MAKTTVPIELSSTPGIVDNSNATAITIDSSENVGIGTSSPNANLEVANGSDAAALILNGHATSQGATSRIQSIREDFTGSTSVMAFSTNNGTSLVERMRIMDDGDVGIGTTSPARLLEVNSNASDVPQIRAAYNSTNYLDIKHNVLNAVSSGGNDALIIQTASTERARFDVNGNLGIGTSSPSTKLDVEGEISFGLSGNNKFTSETNALVGQGTNGAKLRSAISTAGFPSFANSDDTDTGMFTPGSDVLGFTTAGSERMRINDSGDVLIGTTSYVGNAAQGVSAGNSVSMSSGSRPWSWFVGNSDNASSVIYVQSIGSANQELMSFYVSTGGVGSITSDGSNTSYNTSSDYRLKENVQPLQNGLNRLNKLNPVQFDFISSGVASEGFLAHEVQDIFPDAVTGEKDGDKMQSMDYGRITPLLVKAIQEQQEQIESLKSEIELLKGEK